MGEKVALLVDSMCDMPREFLNKFNIKCLPAKIIYPEEEYSDRVDIEPEEVYRRMPAEIPKTSVPSLTEIKDMLLKIQNEGFTHLLAIHISSQLSGTYQAVQLVARDFKEMKIKVIDSKTLTMGTGWLVLDAARNLADGITFDKVVERLQNLQPQVRVYYILETLEYLRRGGRIGRVACMIGEFLHFKPIISVEQDGAYSIFCKVRGRKKSIDKLVEIVEQVVKDKQINLAVLSGGTGLEFEKLVERLRKLPNIKELITSDISPALGVHTGPGLLGISFHEV
ncbi:MAG: DegV family protein [Syntrophomonadaceae bacterium]|nr:DegV family protein [Syntrophomonadaceae bacterium]MDD3889417.1 DegV family protein [Syntrophomonadaceae bacterium]MDD4549509.1 DegV family protein [Syntrophomonadaceae bacterium]